MQHKHTQTASQVTGYLFTFKADFHHLHLCWAV